MAQIVDSDVTKNNQSKLEKANKKLAIKMAWIVLGSLLFAFAMVPLYNVLCEVTGLNGKTENRATKQTNSKIDSNRFVTVQFVTAVMSGLGWNFYPKQGSVTMHPGQIETVMFEVKNITSEVVVGQAIPSITPAKATAYIKKIDCFCFVQQTLKPGEVKLMPLRFYVSPDIPNDINEMTLSYSFFKAVKNN